MKKVFDWKEYAKIARRIGAEGCVLIKNDKETLPLKRGAKVALFGRSQFDYIKSGTGSGGLVNVPYIVNVYDGLKNSGFVEIDDKVENVYREWLKDHPFDKGVGWANEPFSQVEMPLDENFVKESAKNNEVAIVCIARLAGEDKDNLAVPGSYLLQDEERKMIEVVSSAFEKTVVLINSGNIIDMKWVSEINPSAVMYVWQGGIEGGNSVADVLTGEVNPSGHLADTIAYDISDYPCSANFGDKLKNIYVEDIYVGYRYFETFAQGKVLYPFGFGLSYTTFKHDSAMTFDGENITVSTTVTNTGKVAGRDAVEVYYKAPQGLLGKPARELADFAKTGVIAPGKSETVLVTFPASRMASFDDSGVTGTYHAFVLEAGEYSIFEGEDVRLAKCIGSISIDKTVVTEKTSEALAPMEAYKRLVNDGTDREKWEEVPVRRESQLSRIEKERASLKEIPYAGSQKHNLKEVYDGKITMDEFIAGLSDYEMICMTRGEGMCSPRVTSGTAAAFGGTTDKLVSYGIPTMCCSDGPSGIRMDSGDIASQGPNGVALACTFDKAGVEELYEYVGRELALHDIDSLLGPGMNIHRSPLNGRNFEYFSEDPRLTGEMAAAELKGMHRNKVTGTIKHYACNNQELGRHSSDSVVSARALREIYLKGYEIAVKDGGAYMIMSTYGSLNGTHTSGNFDLDGLVLHHDWGYQGLVETDWWALVNDEKGEATHEHTKYMIRGENDVYMVTGSAGENGNKDDAEEGLKDGTYTRAELQRNARNILNVALRTRAFDRLNGMSDEWEAKNVPVNSTVEKTSDYTVFVDGKTEVPSEAINTSKGCENHLKIQFAKHGNYVLYFDVAANGSDLAQIPMVLKLNGTPKTVISRNGSEHEFRTERFPLEAFMSIEIYLGIYFGQDGMQLRNIYIVEEDFHK